MGIKCLFITLKVSLSILTTLESSSASIVPVLLDPDNKTLAPK